MELRILRAPCQRCGVYHDQPKPVANALSVLERQHIADLVRRELAKPLAAPDPPDLAARIRVARGGAR
jgi:hypothetical protein